MIKIGGLLMRNGAEAMAVDEISIQGDKNRGMDNGMLTLGNLPYREKRCQIDLLAARILKVVVRGDRDFGIPGVVPWWIARALLGGSHSTANFVSAVDRLLAS